MTARPPTRRPPCRAAGAHVLLAGRPQQADALQAAGVADFIYAGCDAARSPAAAHSRHCQLAGRSASDCPRHRVTSSAQDGHPTMSQTRPTFRLAQAHRPAQPDRDRDHGLRLLQGRARRRDDVRHHLQRRALEQGQFPEGRARSAGDGGEVSRLAQRRLHHAHRHAGGDDPRQGLRGGDRQDHHRGDRIAGLDQHPLGDPRAGAPRASRTSRCCRPIRRNCTSRRSRS